MVYKINVYFLALWNDLRLRYLAVGGFNTVVGYAISLILYAFWKDTFNIFLIGIFINLISITISFTTYKLFVFQTKGSWLKEYTKSYIIYGIAFIINVVGLWVLVDIWGVVFWLAQASLLLFTVIASYVGHKFFTFKKGGDYKFLS